MVRKFLYLIAILVVLVLAGLLILRLFADDLAQIALVPGEPFEQQDRLADNAYSDGAMWLSRPGQPGESLVRWQPAMAEDDRDLAPLPGSTSDGSEAEFAVFFVHPTSYLSKAEWNAPLDDSESQNLAKLFTKGMASPFGEATQIWVPRYRQATLGAFLTDSKDAQGAFDLAYSDIDQAFSAFLAGVPVDMPIVLAGHSQGALHVLTLLRTRVAGTPLADRIAAAYAVGWPISTEHDLAALGLPACSRRDQSGCVAGWMSYAVPAEPNGAIELYRSQPGFDGQIRGDSPFLCFNPLTGTTNDTADVAANLGTLVPSADLTDGELVRQAVPARCREDGLLLIGDPPELGPFVQPGNDYHVYDIPLFWANLKADVLRRVNAWPTAR